MKIFLKIAITVITIASVGNVLAKNEKYESCLKQADAKYHADWARECKFVADQASKNRTKCQIDPRNSGKGAEYCLSQFPHPTSSASCELPSFRAKDINERHTEAKQVCRDEAKAGL